VAVFIELTTSPIDTQFQQAGARQGAPGSGRAGRGIARRPTRGIEVKSDTYATLKVVKSDGSILPLVDSSAPDGFSTTSGYTNFLLQNVAEQRVEKQQIIETFGASYIFFFGEQPRFLQIQAVLLNTHDFNWEAEWWSNYNTYLRGTKLVEMGARCYLAYDDNVVEGYLTQCQGMKAAMEPWVVQLSFQFFVTNCFNVSMVGNPRFPIRASAVVPASIDLRSKDSGAQLVSNLADAALSLSELRQFDSRGQIARETQRRAIPGTYRTISQMLREAPPSFAVSADWWPALTSRGPGNQAGLMRLVNRSGNPIRSLIANNIDEFVGYFRNEPVGPYTTDGNKLELVGETALTRRTRNAEESADLFRQATEMLGCYGADINNPRAHSSLGLGVSFSASASAGASFGAAVGGGAYAGASFSAGAGVGLGAVAGGGYRTSAVTQSRTGRSTSAFAAYNASASFQTDSLGVVYGKSVEKTITKNGVTTTRRKFSGKYQQVNETGFDYEYGYESSYDSGPGYGKTGFGDFGGNGFGSGLSGGDPGFKDPDRFTFAGVADNQGAYERFIRQRTDNTALTPGRRAGRGELSGGASIEVSGKVSAFAVVSVQGELDLFGNARSSSQYQSDQLTRTRFGFGNDNPFGVNCARPGSGLGVGGSSGLGFSASAGFNTSASASLSVGVGFQASASAGVSVGF
jgi:hypothetical protein